MQRGGESERPVKGRRHRAIRPKARKAPTASLSDAGLQEQLDQRTRERDEALERETATSEILRIISNSPTDLQSALGAIAESAARLLDVAGAEILRVEGDGLRLMAEHGALAQRPVGSIRPINRGLVIGRAVIDRTTVQVLDLQAAEREFPEGAASARQYGHRTTLATPLLREGTPIGGILIRRMEVRPFTDKQIALLQNFAGQAVIAIENARLLNELRESLQQQTATADVLKVISSSPGDLEPVFKVMLENAVHICEAKFGTMLRAEESGYRVVAMHGPPPAYAAERQRNPVLRVGPTNPLARVAASKQLQHIADIRTERAYLDRDPAFVVLADDAGARTLLMVPMLKESNLVGAIAIYRQEVRPFTEKQIELLQNFAAQAVIAIENTRLLNELRQRTGDLSEALEQQTATSEVLKVISSSPGDLEPVFQAILANATRICDAKFGVLFRHENGMFRAAATLNAPQAFVEFHRERGSFKPPAGTPLDRLLKAGGAIYSADEATNPGAPARLGGARSLVTVPMRKDGQLIGAIIIYRQEVRPFTDKQIELLTNFAAQAVIAIENTRLLNELRESLQQQTATADVLKIISRSTFDLQAVLDTLVQSAARLCEAEMVTIARQKGTDYQHVAFYGYPPEFQRYMKNAQVKLDRGSVIGRAITARAPVQITDVLEDPDYTQTEAQQLGGYRTLACVPMMREGNPTGVFTMIRTTVSPFTEKQIELASIFADQAAIAIENVRLFDSVQARTRELTQSLDELRTTQDRLVQTQKLASLGQLTAGIAHEIKNPLNFVNNFSGISAELIDELQDTLKGPLDEKARVEIKELTDTLRGNLDKVVQHGKRADAIVKNMLQHSREGTGEHRVIDINALVEESLNLAWHGARAETQGFEIKLKQSFDPAAGEADIFPQDIRRALLNMISNGFYAATKRRAETNGGDYEPTLTASTKNLGDRVEIRIRDNGTGMPPDVKEKMFNPFFTTKPTGEGTGLGLSISHDIIVKQHGGSIEVDSQPGEFTEIRVILPRGAALLPERS
jgi:two-component system, NtrC family, sensor kinase